MTDLLNGLLEEEKQVVRDEWQNNIGHMVNIEPGAGDKRRFGFRLPVGCKESKVVELCSYYMKYALLFRYGQIAKFMMGTAGPVMPNSNTSFGVTNYCKGGADKRKLEGCSEFRMLEWDAGKVFEEGTCYYVSQPFTLLVDPDCDFRVEFRNSDRTYVPEWEQGSTKCRVVDAYKIVQGESEIFVAGRRDPATEAPLQGFIGDQIAKREGRSHTPK